MDTFQIFGYSAIITIFYLVVIMEWIRLRRDNPFKKEKTDKRAD